MAALVAVLGSVEVLGQALTINNSGNTGTSGSGWTSTDNGTTLSISVTGSAVISPTVLTTALNAGKNVFITASSASIDHGFTTTNASSVRLTIKTTQFIVVQANTTISSSNAPLDLVFWADSDNSQNSTSNTSNDEILLYAGVNIITNGGLIHFAGGLDGGANGGVSNDNLPDGYAYRGAAGGIGGLQLGAPTTTGTTIVLASNGGNITLRGMSGGTAAGARPGITSQASFRIDAGYGKIDLQGFSTVGHGIEFTYGVAPDIGITSLYSGSGPAVRIAGGTTLAGGYKGILLFNNLAGNFLVQSASSTGGGILLEAGSANSSNPGYITTQPNAAAQTQFLSGAGDIEIRSAAVGGSAATGALELYGNMRFGTRVNATAVAGVVPSVTTSQANVKLVSNSPVFDPAGASVKPMQIATTGTVSILPVSTSFSAAQSIRNLSLTNVSGLTFGASGNTAAVTVGQTLNVAGPITVFGGDVAINNAVTASGTMSFRASGVLTVAADITSNGNSDVFLKSGSSANPSLTVGTGRTITKSNGTGTLTLQAHGRVQQAGTVTTSGTGVLNVVVWSDFDNTNNDGGVSVMGPISTNGGHVWLGGSSTNGGSYTWNGLAVGDGPSVASAGYNANSMDLYSNITTNGGDFLAWAGESGYGIANDGTGDFVDVGSGDVVLITDYVFGAGNLPLYFKQNGGTITLVPENGSYPKTFLWDAYSETSLYGAPSYNFEDNFNYFAFDNPSLLLRFTIGYYDGMLNGSTPVVFSNSTAVTFTTAAALGGALQVYGGALALNANLSTSNTTLGNVVLSGTSLSGTGNLAVAAGRTATLSVSSASTYDGVVSGTGSSLTKLGAGTLTLSKDHTYSGATQINAGALQVGTGGSVSQASSGSIANTSGVAVASGAKLILAPNENVTFDRAVSGDGGVEISGRSGAYYSSFLTTSWVTLAANTTVLEALTRITGARQNGQAVAGGVTKQAGAYAKQYNAAANTATFEFQQYDGVYTKVVFILLRQNGSNVEIAINPVPYGTGAGYIQANVLGTSLATGGSFMPLATNTGAGTGYGIDRVYLSGKVNFTGTLTYTGTTTLTSNTTTGSGNNIYSYVSKGTQEIKDNSSSFPGAVVNNGLVVFNRSTPLTVSANMSGTEEILQVGAAITLTGTNTYSGLTTVDLNKSLSVGAGGTVGSLTSNVLNYGTLTFDRSDASSYAGVVSGSGVLVKSGAGVLTFTGLPTLTGTTTINAGELVVERNVPAAWTGSIGGAGVFRIQPASASFTSTTGTSGWNLGSTLGGFVLGKVGNTSTVQVNSTVSIAGPITLYGGTVNATSAATTTGAGSAIRMESSGPVNLTAALTTNGGPVVLWANNDGSGTAYVRTGNITTNGGSLWAGGGSGSRVWNGVTVGNSFVNYGTSGSGIYVNGTLDSRVTATPTTGGDIMLCGGTENGGSFADITAENSTRSVLAGNGDISLLSRDGVYIFSGSGIVMSLQTTGSVSLAPVSGANWLSNWDLLSHTSVANSFTGNGVGLWGVRVMFPNALGSLNLGTYSGTGLAGDDAYVAANTQNISISSPLAVAGTVRVLGGDLALYQGITTSTAGEDIWLRGTGKLEASASKTLQTNGGDITLWSDYDANGGTVLLNDQVSLDSRTAAGRAAATTNLATGGGTITIGGGSASSTLASGTEVPTGYVLHSGTATQNGALLLGSLTSGHNAAITIYSGGGDIVLRGKSTFGNTSGESNGIMFYEGITMDAGADGDIVLDGQGSNGTWSGGVYTSYNVSSAAGTLLRTHNGNISITGSGDGATNNRGLILYGGSSKEFVAAATGSGTVTVTGTGSTQDLVWGGGQLLAASGTVSVTGAGAGPIEFHTGGSNVLGSAAGSPVTGSSSTVVLTDNAYSVVGGNGLAVSTTGHCRLESAGSSFGSALTYPLGTAGASSSLGQLTVGKSTNTANVTLGAAVIASNDITVYGGTLTVNGNLTSTNGAVSLYSDSPLAGLSSTSRSVNAGGMFRYAPQGATFNAAVSYPITNLSVTANGLTLGKLSNASDITLASALTVGGPVEVYGDDLVVSAGLTAAGDVVFDGATLDANGNVKTTGTGSDVTLDVATASFAPGTYLWSSGGITNNGALTLEAENAADGAYSQMKFGGTFTAGAGSSITQQQYLEEGRHLMGSPFAVGTAAFFGGNNPGQGGVGASGTGYPSGNMNLFGWSGSDWEPLENNNAVIASGKGYIGSVGTNGFRLYPGVQSFTGTLPNASTTVSILKEPAHSGVTVANGLGRDGWNLVANPFPCAIDATNIASAGNGLNGAVYRWNPRSNNNNGAYEAHSPAGAHTDNHIAPLQAFWVQATNSGQVTLSMNTHGTVLAAPVFRKTTDFEADRFRFEVVRASQPTYKDFSYIALAEGTTDGFDPEWDAHKLASGDRAVYLYSHSLDGAALANNAVSYSSEATAPKQVPLAFRAPGHGETFTLTVDTSLAENDYDVFLEDQLKGTLHNVRAGGYSFVHDSTITERFVVHFRSAKARDFVQAGGAAAPLNVWTRSGELVFWMNQPATGRWTLMGLDGKEIQFGKVVLDGTSVHTVPIDAALPHGVYLVRTRLANGSTVFVRVML